MNKTIKIVVMLFLTLILNTVVNADSSKNNTQKSSKNEVEKIDYTLATFTPEYIKNLSDSQIKFHKDNIKKNLDKKTIANKADKRMEHKRVLFGLQKEELKREKEETKSYERVQSVLDDIVSTSKQKE